MKYPFLEAGFILGVLSVIMVLLSGPGTRIGLFPFTIGLLLIGLGSLTGLAAVIMSIARLSSGPQNLLPSMTGLVSGLVTSGLLAFSIIGAGNTPMIHDITTDTVNPPQYVSVLPFRKNALNPVEYEGSVVSDKQKKAFPDIQTLRMKITPDEAFEKSLGAVQALKWKIVDQKKGEGRIEAFDTTFWFGFKDDIVIRITKDSIGSVIDIRSLSRVGGGDMGTNARRVRKFIKLMNS
jgi:uncharacterized protein (DUF1499 family)